MSEQVEPENGEIQPDARKPGEPIEIGPNMRMVFGDVDVYSEDWTVAIDRTSPMYEDFGYGPEKVGGYLAKLTDDDQLTQDYIMSRFGGGNIALKLTGKRKNKKKKTGETFLGEGFIAHATMKLSGRPKPLEGQPEMQIQRRGNGGPPPPNARYAGAPAMAPAEAQLAGRMYERTASREEKSEERYQRMLDTERRAREQAERETAQFRERMAKLEAGIEGRKADNEHERGMLAIMAENSKTQIEMLRMQMQMQEKRAEERDRQRQAELAELRAQRDKADELATAPYRQFAEDQARRAARDIEAAETRARQMMEMQRMQHEQSMAFLREQMQATREMQLAQTKAEQRLGDERLKDMRAEMQLLRAEKRKSVTDELSELQKTMKILKGLSGEEEGSGDVWEQLVGMIPEVAPHADRIVSSLGQAIQGIRFGVPIPQPAPAADALPEQQAAEQAAAAKQAEVEAEQLINMITNAYQKGVPPLDLASSIVGTMGVQMARQLTQPPVNEVVGYLGQVKPELGSLRAQEYLKQVYGALREVIGGES